MFYREGNRNGVRIEWNPPDEQAAEQAMTEVVDRFDGWSGSRYKLDDETAESVRTRYNEILEGQA